MSIHSGSQVNLITYKPLWERSIQRSYGKSVKNKFLFTIDGLPQPNPDDAGPIVCRPMGLPITDRCDSLDSKPVTIALRCSALDRWTTWEFKKRL